MSHYLARRYDNNEDDGMGPGGPYEWINKMPEAKQSELQKFFDSRWDFLRVYATPALHGDGFDVVIRIDGTYYSEALGSKEEAAQQMARQFVEALVADEVDISDKLFWDTYKTPTDSLGSNAIMPRDFFDPVVRDDSEDIWKKSQHE